MSEHDIHVRHTNGLSPSQVRVTSKRQHGKPETEIQLGIPVCMLNGVASAGKFQLGLMFSREKNREHEDWIGVVGMVFLTSLQVEAQAVPGQKAAGQDSQTMADQDIKLLRTDLKISRKKQLIAENHAADAGRSDEVLANLRSVPS